jgi:hypothetical protein
MEVSNVARQLYEKQLPSTNQDFDYSCNNTFSQINVPGGLRTLSTCDDPVVSDKKIESAFQDQLTMSEYFKGDTPYIGLKKNYSDMTMEFTPGAPPEQNAPSVPTPVTPPSAPVKPVTQVTPPVPTVSKFSETDKNHSKSTFGDTVNCNTGITLLMFILFAIAVIFLIIYLFKNKTI